MMAKYGFVRAIVIAGVCLVGGMSASAALAQTVKVHVSSHGGDRLTAKPDVQFSESEDAGGAASQVNGHGNAQANAHDNPITRRDVDQHVYGELAMEVPYHGDPYASDLPSKYWLDVRKLVATRLAQ